MASVHRGSRSSTHRKVVSEIGGPALGGKATPGMIKSDEVEEKSEVDPKAMNMKEFGTRPRLSRRTLTRRTAEELLSSDLTIEPNALDPTCDDQKLRIKEKAGCRITRTKKRFWDVELIDERVITLALGLAI